MLTKCVILCFFFFFFTKEDFYFMKSRNSCTLNIFFYWFVLLFKLNYAPEIITNNNFKLPNESLNLKNQQICSNHKLLKIPQTIFNFPYFPLIPNFYKNPISFSTVTTGRNTYSNSESKILNI